MSNVPLVMTLVRSMKYALEVQVAQLAVRRAALLTSKVSNEHIAGGGISKEDSSPVTIGDFGAQGVVIGAIAHNFPTDEVVGEEDSALIREKGIEGLVFENVEAVQAQDAESSKVLGSLASAEAMCAAIDRGNSQGGSKGRVWALDPIDGTKGFLRGDQYAVCLALIVDGQVQVGVVGCPNLPHDLHDPNSPRGGLFTAVRGHGSFFQPLNGPVTAPFDMSTPIHVHNELQASQARVVEGVEKGHSAHGLQGEVKAAIGIQQPSVNLDSQVKYCALAKGDAEIYLRLPTKLSYREKIWDHAAGYLLVREAGGLVTDMYGNDLNFGHGRMLPSQGVIAATTTLHSTVIGAVKGAVGDNGERLSQYAKP